MRFRSIPWALAACLTLPLVGRWASAGPVEDQTVRDARQVVSEFRALALQGIPDSLLKDAQGIAVVPGVIKAGFVLAGRHGRGLLFVRKSDGQWSDPLFVSLSGGSVGWQVGIDSTDAILVFKSRRGVDGILSGRKFTLGADASIAAGPVGRQAQAATDPRLQAEVYSYSRSRGLFAGVALGGSVIKFDERSNTWFYGQFLTPSQIIESAGLTNSPTVSEIKSLLVVADRPTAATPTVAPLAPSAGLAPVPFGAPATAPAVRPAPPPPSPQRPAGSAAP